MVFTRFECNPIVTPKDVRPSREDFEVIGTFNAGVTIYGGNVLLLVRVAERPIQSDPAHILYPFVNRDGQMVVGRAARANGRYNTNDPRVVFDRLTGETFLTSISHVRAARSPDGQHFAIDEQPWLRPESPYESFGVEDARITRIDDTYYVNYSAVSPLGISTGLVSTSDFVKIQRHGIIFPPSNRDVTIFPVKIDGHYACYHRPMPSPFGGLNIWLATSPDLLRWGDHKLVLQTQPGGWEAGRVGGGAPPLRTEEGWLSIYHAADPRNRYCLGAFLTALDDPAHILRRSLRPVLLPAAPYETEGFFGNVVFTCGAILDGDRVVVYYGAADEVIAAAEARLSDVLATMVPV